MAWQTSDEYNEIIYSGDAKHKLKLLFNNVEYTTANEQTESVKVTSKILSSGEERFSLDNFVSKEVEIVIRDINLEDIVEPIEISIGTLIDEENETYEYVPIGIFNLSENPTTDSGKTTMKLRDNSVKFDTPYDASEIIEEDGGEVTMIRLLQDICDKCEVELGTTEFPNMDTKISVWDNTINARQYVMYIAEKADRIATIDRLGKLTLINLNQSELESIQSEDGYIYINNALSKKLNSLELQGNTQQDSYAGKNLLKNTNVNSGDGNYWQNFSTFDEATGTLTRSTTATTESYITHRVNGLESNTTYTVSCLAKSNGNVKDMDIYCFNKNTQGIKSKTHISLTTNFQKYEFTFTTSSDVDYSETSIRFDNNGSNTSGTEAILTIKDVMLVEGTDTDFEPYTGGIPSPNPDYPQTIDNVTGLQELNIIGNNLYKPTLKINNTNIAYTNCSVSLENDEYSFIASSTNEFYFGQVVGAGSSYSENRGQKIYKNGHEKIAIYLTNTDFDRIYITAYNSSGVSLGYSYILSNSGIYTFPENADFITIRYGKKSPLANTTYKTKVMVVYGDELPAEYEEYKEQSYEINLGDIELCKIVDYQDKIYKYNNKWYKIPNVLKIESYNGETITTDYKSTTGGLDTGATIYYGNDNPMLIEITDTELIEQLETILNTKLYDGINNITLKNSSITSQLEITYQIEKEPIELNPLLFEKYTVGDEIKISRVVYEDAIRKFEYGVEDNQTLYINSANPYITDTSEIENIYDEISGFNIYSLNISKMIGNPALDPWDIIKFTYNDVTYKTLAQNTLTYNGVIIQSFDTQLGSKEKAQENVTINREDTKFKRVFTRIDQAEGNIELNTSQITLVQSDLEENHYTKEQTNQLVQNAETGVTNTFSEAGGNNIFKNTGLWFADDKVTEYIYPKSDLYPYYTTYTLASQHYEYWNGYVEKVKNENSSNMSAMLLKKGYLEQKQDVPNGKYTVSFKYQKLINLAVCKVSINNIEYNLTQMEETEFVTGQTDSDGNYIVQPLEVSNREIAIKFYCDTDNSCQVYDLMVNAGSVKLAYSQNQNETNTDTVNISKGITITSSDTDTVFKANADGIRTLNSKGNILTEFTDTGMSTKKMKVTDEAQICGILIQEVNDQTWFTKL